MTAEETKGRIKVRDRCVFRFSEIILKICKERPTVLNNGPGSRRR